MWWRGGERTKRSKKSKGDNEKGKPKLEINLVHRNGK